MSEISGDSVYGGSMTPEEWVRAEMDVDEELPKFRFKHKSPSFKLNTPLGEVTCHRMNTVWYEFIEEFGFLDHIYIKRKEGDPLYLFREMHDEDVWEQLTDFLHENDFDYRYSAKQNQVDMEMYHTTVRGNEPIEEIIGRIVAEGEFE